MHTAEENETEEEEEEEEEEEQEEVDKEGKEGRTRKNRDEIMHEPKPESGSFDRFEIVCRCKHARRVLRVPTEKLLFAGGSSRG